MTEGGLTADHVNDAVRIAATINAAVAREAGGPAASDGETGEPSVIEVPIERA